MVYVEVSYAAGLHPTMDLKLAQLAERFRGKMVESGMGRGSRVVTFEYHNAAEAKSFAAAAREIDGVEDVRVIFGAA